MKVATLLLLAASLALASGVRADDSAAAPAKPPAPAPAKPLDLRPPEITKLYTSRQLAELLDKIEKENIEEVEVEGARERRPTFTPSVWPGIGAPFWALFHPTQAWRIFAPIPPDQARFIGTKPAPYTDAGYLDPAGVPPGPFDH